MRVDFSAISAEVYQFVGLHGESQRAIILAGLELDLQDAGCRWTTALSILSS